MFVLTLVSCQQQSQPPEVALPPVKQDQQQPTQTAKRSIQPAQESESPIEQPPPIHREEGRRNSLRVAERDKMILDVPIISQNPELKYGCEVTSLAMVLQYAGVQVDKMQLASQLPRDDDPIRRTPSGDITHWGNPHHGFVGDITGKRAGYAIFVEPLEKLMARYLPNRTVNLTGRDFDEILGHVKENKPVIVWTTGDFKAPDRWEGWKHKGEYIKTPLDLHAVVLVGYDPDFYYVNDPLTGNKAQKVNKASFLESWRALGKQALSYE
jgi:uncharacterized protein YvpB